MNQARGIKTGSAGRVAERKASDTRQALLLSARALFAEARFESVKVSEIVAAAGVSQGTFYYHFNDKEAVLVEILEEFFEKGRTLTDAWAVTEDSSAETIAAFARQVAGLVAENRDIVRIMTGELGARDRRVAGMISDFYQDLYERVTRAMELGISLGIVRACDARIAAVAHVGMIKEVVQDQVDRAEDGEADLEHVVAELLSLIYRGIRVQA